MTPSQLHQQIQQKQSLLCVGLDTDPLRIPKHLHKYDDPIFEFNKQIIEATAEYAIAYKPNIAFYEAQGTRGWESLRKTLEIIPEECFTIADAKRGDIGNTSRLYARAFFETFDFDSITVAPYMGKDSVLPFLEYENKWVFVLGLTSNAGAKDFQWHGKEGAPLYKEVFRKCLSWESEAKGNLGFVVGATKTEYLKEIREICPENFLLVPGIGAQGGDLEGVCKNGRTEIGELFINSSRGIIYAGEGEDFAMIAGQKAKDLQQKIAELI